MNTQSLTPGVTSHQTGRLPKQQPIGPHRLHLSYPVGLPPPWKWLPSWPTHSYGPQVQSRKSVLVMRTMAPTD